MRLEQLVLTLRRSAAVRRYRAGLPMALLLAVGVVANVACTQSSNVDAKTLLERARAYVDQGELHAAVDELKAAVHKDLPHHEARWVLGQIYLTLRQGELALLQFEKLRAEGFNAAQLPAAYFRSLLMRPDFKRLIEESVGNSNPDVLATAGEAHLGLVDTLSATTSQKTRQQHVRFARVPFERALRGEPENAAALLGQARIACSTKSRRSIRKTRKRGLSAA